MMRSIGTAWCRIAVGVCASILTGGAASGQVQNVSLRASHDNTLYEDGFGLTSNGKGQYMFVGVNGGSVKRRGIIRFDLTCIPPGATITNVTLTMNMSRSNAGTQSVALHRVLASWGEGASNAGAEEGSGATSKPGDASWIHRFFPDSFWTAPGGDFLAGPSASTNVGSGGTTWSSPGMVADVQAWVSGGAGNFGWVLKGNESAPRTAKRFDTREHPTTSRQPLLQVTYNGAPPISGACCLPTGVCSVTLAGQCENQGGVYQGNGASCSPNPCPPTPTGACCNITTGTCTITTALDCAAQNGVYQGNDVACGADVCPPALTPFVDALPIPAVATPTSGVAGGAAHYDIAITRFTQQLHRDLPPTTVYGYAGTYPGPTIEAHEGQPVTVRWINDLRGQTGQLLATHDLAIDECLHGPDVTGTAPLIVTHLHGGHVPADSDGYPEDTVAPGASSSVYDYPNNQRAATIWYHDHSLGITRLNVYMGLAGFYLLRDATEDALNLPRGQFEIPLAIQDRSFFQDGRLRYHNIWMEHFFGEFILVNGKVWPYLNVAQGKYRFRILNGSGSRAYTLSLSNGRLITQIGSDGGLLNFPVPQSSITILPGERADVIIDFEGLTPGTHVTLLNSAPAPFPGEEGVGVVPNVMRFMITAAPGDTDPVPATLSTVTPMVSTAALRERPLVLRPVPFMCMHAQERDFIRGSGHGETMWAINDLMWDDIVEQPRLNTTEIWSWINRSNISHPMHMHLVSFQVLNRQAFTVIDGVPTPTGPIILPPPQEKGWKDTVNAQPGVITRVIAKFEAHTGLFSYHCHILEHEDNEMMRQFRARPVCLGDANDDGLVNFSDVTTVLANFGASGPRGIQGDANLNGLVDFGDVTSVLANFANSCL